MSSPKRKNFILIGSNLWDNPEKHNETSFCKHIDRELCHAGRDIEVISLADVNFGIKDSKLFMHLSDGRTFTKDSSDLPKWILCYVVPARIVHMLEQMGIAAYSSYDMLSCVEDKMMSHAIFADVFKQPDTLFYGTDETVNTIVDAEENYPFILKGVSGAGGENVCKVDCFDEMISFADEREHNTELLMMQQLMPTADDLRVYMLGDEILGAVLRQPKEGIWKANLEFGPKRSIYNLSKEEESSIRAAMDLLPEKRRGMYSFDFLFDDDRSLVMCEANCNVGTNALDAVGLGDDIFLHYVDYIRREMARES